MTRFDEHLNPTPMFQKGRGIILAKHHILDWWEEIEKQGEVRYLQSRLRKVDSSDMYRIVQKLLKINRRETMGLLSAEQRKLESDGWNNIVELIAEDATLEDYDFFMAQRSSVKLDVKVAAARALLDLGNEEVFDELLRFWQKLVDEPERLKQALAMDNWNEIIDLVNFLASCNRTDAIDALSQSLPRVDPDLCSTILDCVERNFRQPRSVKSQVAPQPKDPLGACIRLYLRALDDVREIRSEIVWLGERENEENLPVPRVCDEAAGYLIRLREGEAPLNYRASIAVRNERIDEIRRLYTKSELPNEKK
jgi:hypothetical protein